MKHSLLITILILLISSIVSAYSTECGKPKRECRMYGEHIMLQMINKGVVYSKKEVLNACLQKAREHMQRKDVKYCVDSCLRVHGYRLK